jgi:hypothetical protein
MLKRVVQLAILLALPSLTSNLAHASFNFTHQTIPAGATLQSSGPYAGLYLLSANQGTASTIDLISHQATDNTSSFGTNVILGYITFTSSADAESPDTVSLDYSLDVTLTDTASGQSGTLVFTGHLGGNVANGQANISNTYTGNTNQSIVLGNVDYTVNSLSYSPPGGAGGQGQFGATVYGAAIPEPSSIILVMVGMLGTVGLIGRQKSVRKCRAACSWIS